MDCPCPSQIRAARALLDWSIVDLVNAARVSVSEVKRCEDGRLIVGSESAVALIQDALETEGVLFLAANSIGPGVRYKPR